MGPPEAGNEKAKTKLIFFSHKTSLGWWQNPVSQIWTLGINLDTFLPYHQVLLILPSKALSNPAYLTISMATTLVQALFIITYPQNWLRTDLLYAGSHPCQPSFKELPERLSYSTFSESSILLSPHPVNVIMFIEHFSMCFTWILCLSHLQDGADILSILQMQGWNHGKLINLTMVT